MDKYKSNDVLIYFKHCALQEIFFNNYAQQFGNIFELSSLISENERHILVLVSAKFLMWTSSSLNVNVQ